MDIPEESLANKDVEVVNVTQVTGSEAIVETRLKTAFRVEKVRGKWIVREVRLGHGQWEKVSDLVQALDYVKTQETQTMLDTIAASIERYRIATGRAPAFKDYVSLSDILSPEYMTPLIRLDAWRKPFKAELGISNRIVIRSAGPDGKYETPDDIVRTIRWTGSLPSRD